MQTLVQWDANKGTYKPKLSKLEVLHDDKLIGHAQINLADFVVPKKYVLYFSLFSDDD